MSETLLRIVAVVLLVGCAIGDSFGTPPRPVEYIRDDASLLSSAAERELANLLERVERERDIEILVVTIDQIPRQRRNFVRANRSAPTIESYAKELFNHYRIGSLPANQGVLLLVAKQDRSCRIELGSGYSTDLDAVARRIIDTELLPEFRQGNYEKGIKQCVGKVATSIAGLTVEHERSTAGWWWTILPAAFLSFWMIVGASLTISGKRGWGWVVVGLVYLQYLRLRNWSQRPSRGGGGHSSDGNWFDHVDSFGGSDTLHSGGISGGGFSDGGGASGNW